MQRHVGTAMVTLTSLVWLGAAALSGQEAERQEPIVPVYDEPHHRQVFQHGTTRILDLQLPPGDRSWFHSHESPVLYVTLSNSQLRTQNFGEDWGGRGQAGRGARGGRGAAPPSTAPASQAVRPTSTTSYFQQPLTHRLENIGTGLLRAMVVINETAGDEATTVAAAGFAGEPELTNRWFRAYRVELEPGMSSASHQHQVPVAVIQATAGQARADGGMSWEFNEPGQWAFFDAGARHEFRNTGNRGVELIEVELRQPVR